SCDAIAGVPDDSRYRRWYGFGHGLVPAGEAERSISEEADPDLLGLPQPSRELGRGRAAVQLRPHSQETGDKCGLCRAFVASPIFFACILCKWLMHVTFSAGGAGQHRPDTNRR